MTEEPLNFNAPMAAALWRHEKWQTRRPVRDSALLRVLDGDKPDP